MAYTWTTGEVITAAKLNATGGGDYDLELNFNFYNDSETGLVSNCEGEGVGASFTALRDKILSGEPLKVKLIECQYTGTDLTVKASHVSQMGSYNAYDEYMPTPGATLAFYDLYNFTMSSADILYNGKTFSYVYDSTTGEYTLTYISD